MKILATNGRPGVRDRLVELIRDLLNLDLNAMLLIIQQARILSTPVLQDQDAIQPGFSLGVVWIECDGLRIKLPRLVQIGALGGNGLFGFLLTVVLILLTLNFLKPRSGLQILQCLFLC